jgi:hypothetical protein
MMRMHNRRDRLAIAAVLAVVVSAVTATASFSGSSNGDTTYSSLGVATPRAAGSGVTPSSLLAAIVRRVGDPSVVAASLGGPPPGVHESDDPSVPNSASFAASQWLDATVRSSGNTPVETTKPIWLGNLITGALRDELFAASLKPLRSSVVSLVLSDGSEVASAGGGIGAVTPGQIFSAATDAQITAQLDSAAQAAGLHIDSLSIVRADQPAPAVVATTSDPNGAAVDPDAVLTALFGPPGTYEGEYLELRAPDGTPVLVQGSAFRTGVGQRWVNPAYGGSNDAPPPAGGG